MNLEKNIMKILPHVGKLQKYCQFMSK